MPRRRAALSLRMRLALWYCALTGAVVILVCFYSYAVHSRTHYDELDITLRNVTEHVAQELATAPSDEVRARVLMDSYRLGTEVRVYEMGGGRRVVLPTQPAVPVDVNAVLAGPAPSAYPAIATFAPRFHPVPASPGVFGLTSDGAGARWRVFVLPGTTSDGRSHYLVAAVPLAHLDAAVRDFGRLMMLMAVVGCALTFLAGWLIAGRALRPVTTLTNTARSIAQSRVFSQRVDVGAGDDELGRLAMTFNEMLVSLEQAYRAQQRFVSDASHELRAPITVIQGNLELLQRHASMPAADREQAVTEAHAETTRLARIVTDLLVLARADAGVPIRRAPVELDPLLMEVVGESRHLVRGHRLNIEAIEPVIVEGDADRLKQLLLILIDNAIKYTPAGGPIDIALRRRRGFVEFRIRDAGIGIAKEELLRVFERFYRADPARRRDPGGTGLGLSIARWIAMQHGGSIELVSTEGEGTTATVELPLMV